MAEQLNVRIPKSTSDQIDDLITWTGMTQTQIVLQAIDRLHQTYKKERDTMNVDFGTLIEQAKHLPFEGGSLTFRMSVAQRDWDAVKALLPSQQDSMHGVSILSTKDYKYLAQEAQKDGYSL